MSRFQYLSLCIQVGAALLCAGCELPHGPLRWEPVQLDLLKHHPFHLAEACDDCQPACAAEKPEAGRILQAPYGDETETRPAGPRLPRHHTAVPLAGPGLNAPWPKFHPVPTRPVFEPRCLPPQGGPSEFAPGNPVAPGQ